jgi:hypothetical protein
VYDTRYDDAGSRYSPPARSEPLVVRVGSGDGSVVYAVDSCGIRFMLGYLEVEVLLLRKDTTTETEGEP